MTNKKTFRLLNKMMLRTIKQNLMQFIAIIVIGAIAVTLFVGLHANADVFEMQVNQVYEEGNLADLWVTTESFDKEDLSKIKVKTSKTEDGVKRKRHNNAFGQVPFYMFKQILTYKATLVGKQVVSVSPCFTSQTDSRSSKKEGIRSGCRFYCVDGVVLDADWNAAVNIAQKSKHPLSSNVLPIDGKLSFLSGRHSSVCQSSNDVTSRWASPLL